MKKNLFFIALLSYSSFSFTMRTQPITRVILPGPDILAQRLLSLEYHEFLTLSNIHIILGDQKKAPSTVLQYVNSSLNGYYEYRKNRSPIAPIPLSKEAILSAIFQDHPSVMESLREHNLLS